MPRKPPMFNPMKLDIILKGGQVTRFHTKPTLKAETVAEHSYLVAWLTTLVLESTPRADLLLAALAHDIPEYVLGDMPSPAKRAMNLGAVYRTREANLFAGAGMPDYEGRLTPYEAEVLKFCDNLAGYLKCRFEEQMGNRTLTATLRNYRSYIDHQIMTSELLPQEICRELMQYANTDHFLTKDEAS